MCLRVSYTKKIRKQNFFICILKVTEERKSDPELDPDPLVRGADRVADPHWFNADPDTDPAFFLIADPESGSRVLWPKIERIYSWKVLFLFSWSKIAIYLSLGLHKGRPSSRKSLQPSKENIQHFKSWKFCTFLYFFWVIFALLDPDPQFECGSGSAPKCHGSPTLALPVKNANIGHYNKRCNHLEQQDQ